METVIFLLVCSTCVQFLGASVPRAVVEAVSGQSRVFSGQNFKLRCSVPNIHNTKWNYLWFKDSEKLRHTEEVLSRWRSRVTDSGKYYCQGVRTTATNDIYSDQSEPLEVRVDGGWAILKVPQAPIVVGETLKVTCDVRGNPPLHQVTLYRDGVEVMTQKGHNPHLHLNNVTLQDQGLYSCRASWNVARRTHSVISVDAPVEILEVLSEPILEIAHVNLRAKNMELICHVEYNARAPAPPLHYYYYLNNEQLGSATSRYHILVRQTPGEYSCKARVPLLGLSRQSQPKSYST